MKLLALLMLETCAFMGLWQSKTFLCMKLVGVVTAWRFGDNATMSIRKKL